MTLLLHCCLTNRRSERSMRLRPIFFSVHSRPAGAGPSVISPMLAEHRSWSEDADGNRHREPEASFGNGSLGGLTWEPVHLPFAGRSRNVGWLKPSQTFESQCSDDQRENSSMSDSNLCGDTVEDENLGHLSWWADHLRSAPDLLPLHLDRVRPVGLSARRGTIVMPLHDGELNDG
jgi:hypothetical protein